MKFSTGILKITYFFYRKVLVGAAWVDVPAQPTAGLIRRTRLPQIGLYEHPLNCILVSLIIITKGLIYFNSLHILRVILKMQDHKPIWRIY